MLLSESLLPIFSSSEIHRSYRSNHCAVEVKLIISKFKRGPGIWKLNIFFIIREEINLIIATYACTPYDPDFIRTENYEHIELMIQISLFWEVPLAQLRGKIIRFSSKEKRADIRTEKSLVNKILIKEEEAILSGYSDNTLAELENLKEGLQVLRESKLRGAFIRSRAQLVKKVEKPTFFFLKFRK